jgi:cytochrome P450
VPKGTTIYIVPWAVNKDKSYWGEDAATFNPERWMPDASSPGKNAHVANGGAASAYSMLTFLHGPRGCIGMAFSKAEFACLLASWIGRFEFELNDLSQMDESKIVIKGGVTARPHGGLFVKTRVVEGW